MANEISDEPAFSWWVKDTLRHRDSIISRVKYNYCLTSHKLGMRVPKIVKEAYDVNSKLVTGFCPKAITKEIENLCIIFEKLGGFTPNEMRKG